MKRFLAVASMFLFAAPMFLNDTASAFTYKRGEDRHSEMTKHYEDSLFTVTENGEFSVEVILPKEGLEMGVNKVDIIIHDKKDRDVTNARIKIVPWMVDMNHGVSEAPQVSERGGGLYSLSNVLFSMTGKWELRLTISSGKVTDSVVITLPAIGAMGHMHTMKAPDMSKIDTASEKKSKRGSYIVSYEFDTGAASVNKLLALKLKVKTADGKPVTGAEIKIAGDMPEHGHGFTTVPEVTEEPGGGEYLVEGIKFSMPGWWVVNFHIMAGGVGDSIEFNLVLK